MGVNINPLLIQYTNVVIKSKKYPEARNRYLTKTQRAKKSYHYRCKNAVSHYIQHTKKEGVLQFQTLLSLKQHSPKHRTVSVEEVIFILHNDKAIFYHSVLNKVYHILIAFKSLSKKCKVAYFLCTSLFLCS